MYITFIIYINRQSSTKTSPTSFAIYTSFDTSLKAVTVSTI
jgi:hypothetical protein